MTYEGFFSTLELTARYKISSRTLGRWMKRERNPFPRPSRPGFGNPSLWSREVVDGWEQVEFPH